MGSAVTPTPMSIDRILHLSTTPNVGGGGGGGWSGPSHLRVTHIAGKRWVGVRSSSPLRARAAVGTCCNLYEVLGVPEGSSSDEIKRGYKRMAKRYHPDASPPDFAGECTRRFIEVHEAYQMLSDPRRRALYDRGLAFSARARPRPRPGEELEEISAWRNHWQDQISELKRRSRNKDSEGSLSWGARIRRKMTESSN